MIKKLNLSNITKLGLLIRTGYLKFTIMESFFKMFFILLFDSQNQYWLDFIQILCIKIDDPTSLL